MSANGTLTGLAAIVGRSRTADGQTIEQVAPEPATPRRAVRKPPAKAIALQPASAKYTDPERVQLKAYVRRNTKIDAEHKWKRENRGDVSDLIETLLSQYLSS